MRGRPPDPEPTTAIVRRYRAGDTLAQIASTARLSQARVLKIIKDFDPPKPQWQKCAVEECATLTRSSNRYCSRHQVRFERFGDPLWKRPLVDSEHGTMVRYKRDRCRCELCRRRNAHRSTEYLHRVHPEMGHHKPRIDSGGMRGPHNPSYFRERTATILRSYAAGDTLAKIGTTVSLSRERVRQIVKNSGVPMPREYKCAVKDCHIAPRAPHAYCSLHRRRFERLGAES